MTYVRSLSRGIGKSFCRLFSANIQQISNIEPFDRSPTYMCSGIRNIGPIIQSEYYGPAAVEDMGGGGRVQSMGDLWCNIVIRR